MSLENLPPGVPAGRICTLNKDGTWTVETEEHYARRTARNAKWRVWMGRVIYTILILVILFSIGTIAL